MVNPFLGFIGIKDVHIVHADGLNSDAENVMKAAEAQINALTE